MKFGLSTWVPMSSCFLSGSSFNLGGWELPISFNLIANWVGVSETSPWLEVIDASLGITMTVSKPTC